MLDLLRLLDSRLDSLIDVEGSPGKRERDAGENEIHFSNVSIGHFPSRDHNQSTRIRNFFNTSKNLFISDFKSPSSDLTIPDVTASIILDKNKIPTVLIINNKVFDFRFNKTEWMGSLVVAMTESRYKNDLSFHLEASDIKDTEITLKVRFSYTTGRIPLWKQSKTRVVHEKYRLKKDSESKDWEESLHTTPGVPLYVNLT